MPRSTIRFPFESKMISALDSLMPDEMPEAVEVLNQLEWNHQNERILHKVLDHWAGMDPYTAIEYAGSLESLRMRDSALRTRRAAADGQRPLGVRAARRSTAHRRGAARLPGERVGHRTLRAGAGQREGDAQPAPARAQADDAADRRRLRSQEQAARGRTTRRAPRDAPRCAGSPARTR